MYKARELVEGAKIEDRSKSKDECMAQSTSEHIELKLRLNILGIQF